MLRAGISCLVAPSGVASRLILPVQATQVVQTRGRRRTLTAPQWVPPVYESAHNELIDKENRALLNQVFEAERSHLSASSGENQVEIEANKVENPSVTGTRRVGLLATKIGMVPQWTNTGERILCTLLQVEENHVVSVTSPDEWYRKSLVGKRKAFNRDGPLWKVTVGGTDGEPWRFTRAYRAQFARAGVNVKEKLGSFLVSEDAVPTPGTALDIRHFSTGQFVTATGRTVDWGFQGGVHRWGMKGQPKRRTTKSHRRIGSVGSVGDARIWPGKRMPGHMGYEWRTVSGLQVVRMNIDKQVIYVKGSVPGDVGETLLLKDCLQAEKMPKEVMVPTWTPSLEPIAEESEETTEKPLGYQETTIPKLFRFTSPSILFTDADGKKSGARDKTKAKIAKASTLAVVHEEKNLKEDQVAYMETMTHSPSSVANMNSGVQPSGEELKGNVEGGEKTSTVNTGGTQQRRKVLAVPATRLPHHILVRIFSYLPSMDVRSCMTVCRHWHNVLAYEDSVVWRSLALRKVPEAALTDPYLLADVPTFKQKLRAYYFSWNPNDTSKNNYLRPNGFTVHRQPVAQSTDGVRGKMGVSTGCHAFELTWDGPLGTVAVIGLATKHAALHCPGYIALLGSDDQSWGWNLVDNSLLHNGQTLGVYPRVNNPPKYQVGERIRMVVDCDTHTAYFERGAEFLGVAFPDLPPVKLFPAVCAVYGNTEVSMVYLGPPAIG